ncbi:MAG: stage II sporulation protein M [Clostridia bacterium]|nr:stage II sporulation protein M [Clostridia bacterium]
MQKGKVVNLRSCNKIFEFAVKNNFLILLTTVFIIGLCIGVFTFGKYETVSLFSDWYIEDMISERSNDGFLNIVLNSFIGSAMLLLLVFICGSSFMGVLLIPLFVGLKSFLHGSIAAMLYSVYSLKGIAFHAVIILPASIIVTVVLLISAKEAMRFSVLLARVTLPQSAPINISLEFKGYCVKFLIISVFVLLSAVVDAIISCNFLNSFTL